MQGGKPPFFHASGPLIGDSAAAATSVEGLRKLALTYKSTVQGKLDLDRYRSTSKGSNKPVDPRFRRTRMAPSCDIMTKSDTKVPSPFHPVKHVPKSSPMVSSMPSSPKRSPRKKNKCLVTQMRSQMAADPLEYSKEAEINTEETPVPVKNAAIEIESPKPFRRMNSLIERTNRTEFKVLKPYTADAATLADVMGTVEKNIVQSCDEGTETSNEDDTKQKVKYTPQISSGDGTRVLNTYIPPPIEIIATHEGTTSKSIITVPYSATSVDRRACVCVKCDRIFNNKHRRAIRSNSSVAGTNTMIQALEYSEMKAQNSMANSMWIMWCLYAFGCFCGLILVSGLAWVMSNDMLWTWVYQQREPPPKSPPFYAFVSHCGAAVIFTVNLVLSSMYKIIILPRNAVFGTVDDDIESRW